MLYLLPSATKLRVSRILSGGGGVCLSACWDTTPQADTPTLGRHPPTPGQTPPGQTTPPPRRLLLRTVRILMECILVEKNSTCDENIDILRIQIIVVDYPEGNYLSFSKMIK